MSSDSQFTPLEKIGLATLVVVVAGIAAVALAPHIVAAGGGGCLIGAGARLVGSAFGCSPRS